MALGTCLGGNGTLVGASANLIVAGLAAEWGLKITFVNYFKVGFLVMFLTILLSTVYVIYGIYNTMKYKYHYQSPLGIMLMASDGVSLTELSFMDTSCGEKTHGSCLFLIPVVGLIYILQAKSRIPCQIFQPRAHLSDRMFGSCS